MPIVDIELVGEPDGDRETLAQRLADAVGATLGSDPRGTWIKLRTLARSDFAENGARDPGVRPVFVTILRRKPPTGDALSAEAMAVAETVASICERPRENVHVLYEPAAGGRIAFGGVLIE